MRKRFQGLKEVQPKLNAMFCSQRPCLICTQAACLPTLHVTDIERRGVYYSSDKWAWNCSGQPHVPIVQYTQVQPTNDVNYFRASIDLSHVSADLRPYIGLFAHLLCE